MKNDRVNAAERSITFNNIVNPISGVNRKMYANPTNSQTSQPPKLLDQRRGKIRLLRYSHVEDLIAPEFGADFA